MDLVLSDTHYYRFFLLIIIYKVKIFIFTNKLFKQNYIYKGNIGVVILEYILAEKLGPIVKVFGGKWF